MISLTPPRPTNEPKVYVAEEHVKGTLMRFEGKCTGGKRRKLQKLRRA